MGYGGPRWEFHIQPDYDNYTRRIKKEDESRIQAFYNGLEKEEEERERERKRQQLEKQEQEEQIRLAEEKAEYRAILDARREAEERRIAHKTPIKKMTPAEKAALEYHHRRIKELAIPKRNPQPAYGGMMYGRCMYQKTRYVEFPQGRSGQPYLPGVDRDRIIPARPNPKDLPPWIGSYSSHKSILSEPMMRKAKEEAANYYCKDAPYYTAEEKSERRSKINAMLREMDEADEAAWRAGHPTMDDPAPVTQYSDRNYYDPHPVEDDATSIFSHADSNGPIVATGAVHMEQYSTKQEVDSHLRRFGGAMTGPMQPYNPAVYVTGMNLPQLQERVVRLQHRPKKLIEPITET